MPGLTLLAFLTMGGSDLSSADLALQSGQAFQRGLASKSRAQQAQPHFRQALEHLEELHRRGVRSPALYLDVGNAAFLAGHPERALWAYHCGLYLNPTNRPLRENLQYLRSQAHYPAGQTRPRTERWLNVDERTLFLLTTASYTMACLSAALWAYFRRPTLLASLLVLVVITIVGVGLLLRLSVKSRHEREHPTVVVAESTTLFQGNGRSYPPHPDIGSLQPGMEARQVLRRGGWIQVELAGAQVGWLPADSVFIVETP